MSQGMYALVTIRPGPEVTEQPRVALADWRVLKNEDGAFLAGTLPNGRTMRFTTSIASADVSARTWITSSGRVYETFGMPLEVGDPAYEILLATAGLFCGGPVLDCTEVFMARMSAAAH